MFKKYVIGLVLSAIGLTISILICSQASAEMETSVLWGVYETEIDYKNIAGKQHPYDEPFYEIELGVYFTSPSGRRIAWRGFYDGDGLGSQNGNVWKIRFMPDELGLWKHSWNFSDGSLSGEGSFQVIDNPGNPAMPGPLKHDPNIHQWLLTSDGTRHVFPNMYSRWNSTEKLPYTDPNRAISEAKDNGFDVLALWSTVYFKNLPMDAENPMIFIDTIFYKPRLMGWHLFEDGILKAAHYQKIYLYDWDGFYSGNNLYDLHKRPISFQNKVIKYWLARTAAYYNLLYNIGFELPEYVDVPSWPKGRAAYVKSIDPWDHLITAHELHDWSYGNSPEISFSALQNDGISSEEGFIENIKAMIKNIIKYKKNPYYYRKLHGKSFHEVALLVWNSPSKPHPHCSECIWNARWQEQGTEASHRKDLWDGLMGGMSYFFYAKDNTIGLKAFRHANAFLKSGVQWWTLKPYGEIVVSGKAYVLAKIGVEYIAYSSSGSNFSLQLPAGDYQWRWFDPAQGTYSAYISRSTNTGTKVFEKPDNNDWVLHIKMVSSHFPTDATTKYGSVSNLDSAE